MKVEICQPGGMTRVEQRTAGDFESWRKPDGSLYIRVFSDGAPGFATIIMSEPEARQVRLALVESRPTGRVLTIVRDAD